MCFVSLTPSLAVPSWASSSAQETIASTSVNILSYWSWGNDDKCICRLPVFCSYYIQVISSGISTLFFNRWRTEEQGVKILTEVLQLVTETSQSQCLFPIAGNKECEITQLPQGNSTFKMALPTFSPGNCHKHLCGRNYYILSYRMTEVKLTDLKVTKLSVGARARVQSQTVGPPQLLCFLTHLALVAAHGFLRRQPGLLWFQCAASSLEHRSWVRGLSRCGTRAAVFCLWVRQNLSKQDFHNSSPCTTRWS